MISAMGRRPVIARPHGGTQDGPARRSGCRAPDSARNVREGRRSLLNTPPAAATSSPRKTTRSSRSISWAMPAATRVAIGQLRPCPSSRRSRRPLDQIERRWRATRPAVSVARSTAARTSFSIASSSLSATPRPSRRWRYFGIGSRASQGVDLLLRTVFRRVGAGVAVMAIGLGFDQRRAVPRACFLTGRGGDTEDSSASVAVDDDRFQAVRRSAVGRRTPHRGDALDRGVFHVLVVLAHEDHRRLPHRGQADPLVERTNVGGAVAEKTDGDLARAAILGRPGSTEGNRQVGRRRWRRSP